MSSEPDRMSIIINPFTNAENTWNQKKNEQKIYTIYVNIAMKLTHICTNGK